MASNSNTAGPANELKFKGFRVFVEVRDAKGVWNKADVLRVESPHYKKITCFIVSEAGLRYRISAINDNQERPDLIYRFFADGIKLDERIINSDIRKGYRLICTGKYQGYDTKYPISFGQLALTDDDSLVCQDEEIVKNIGLISVKFFRARVDFKMSYGGYEASRPRQTPMTTPIIHEESKKAHIAHQTSYGEAVTVSRKISYSTTQIDTDNYPYLQFEFKYRSRQLLEAEGTIAPAAPSLLTAPVPSVPKKEEVAAPLENKPSRQSLSTVIDVDKVNDESELIRLRREVAELRKAAVEHKAFKKSHEKAEHLDYKPDIKPDIKRKIHKCKDLDIGDSLLSNDPKNTADPRKKKVKTEPGQIIDLTLD